MIAHVFPGQGSQFPQMGKDLFDKYNKAKEMFNQANEILGFEITNIMFTGDTDQLKQTKVTQPAIFIHSMVVSELIKNSFKADIVAGHSLGEFSALASSQYITFEDGLILVSKRAQAMQKACEKNPSTMAAILGIDDFIVEEICNDINEVVVPANYNCTGQLVISGSNIGIDIACEKLINAGAKRAIKLPVGGAFHSPLMDSAKLELEEAIDKTKFNNGTCPIYQNVNASKVTDPDEIKSNLKIQLTSPVLWTQTMNNMIKDEISSISEVGPGKVLQGLFKKTKRDIEIINISL